MKQYKLVHVEDNAVPRSYYKSMAIGGLKKKYIAEDVQTTGKVIGAILLFQYVVAFRYIGQLSAIPLILLVSGLVSMFVKTTYPVAFVRSRGKRRLSDMASWSPEPDGNTSVRTTVLGHNKIIFEVDND